MSKGKLNPVKISELATKVLGFLEDDKDHDLMEKMTALKAATTTMESIISTGNLMAMMAQTMDQFKS